MKNYKVIYIRPVIPPEESKQLQNFDGLLSSYDKPRRIPWKGIISGLIVLVGTTVLLVYSTRKDVQQVQISKVAPTSEIRIQEDDEPAEIQKVRTKNKDEAQPDQELAKEVSSSNRDNVDTKIAIEQSKDTEEKNKQTGLDVGYVEAKPKKGFPALYRYLDEQLLYPEAALEIGAEGKVIVKFAIDTMGNPVKIEVEKGVHELLDKAAIHLVENMPVWDPARLNGMPIESTHRIPLFFQVEQKAEKK